MKCSLQSTLLLLVKLLLFPAMAIFSPVSHAHAVIVWAEVVGDDVRVEGYLSDGAHAKGGQVLVTDMSGKKVAQGRLDKTGQFRFAIPEASRLNVRVILGPQHEGSFELPIETGQSGDDFQPE